MSRVNDGRTITNSKTTNILDQRYLLTAWKNNLQILDRVAKNKSHNMEITNIHKQWIKTSNWGLQIIYWGYGAGNIASYGTTNFLWRQAYGATTIFSKGLFWQKPKIVQGVVGGCIYLGNMIFCRQSYQNLDFMLSPGVGEIHLGC